MAHAAPAQGSRPQRDHGGARAGRTGRTTGLWGPFWMAVGYGLWASVTTRHAGAVTGWNILFGFVTGILFGAVYYVLREVDSAIPRIRRAAAWAVFWGVSVGYLHSLSNTSVLWSVILALIIAACAFVMAMYRFYTREVHDDAH